MTGGENLGIHLPQSQQFALRRPDAQAPGFGAFMANAKLTEETVRKIRAEARHWPQRVLMKRYNLARQTIHEIITRQSWANVL